MHSLWYVTGWCKFKCTPLHWHRMALGPTDPTCRFSSSNFTEVWFSTRLLTHTYVWFFFPVAIIIGIHLSVSWFGRENMACHVLCLKCQSEEGLKFTLFFTQSAYDQMPLWESCCSGVLLLLVYCQAKPIKPKWMDKTIMVELNAFSSGVLNHYTMRAFFQLVNFVIVLVVLCQKLCPIFKK